ncbi:hypothetical protein [Streptomyces globisporus]|uniref:hypothetical protein n=1 Tax=Streptomyces globisporus TaxID=1908 RepID=UPI00131CABD8|nr:hypothetical protein [Streptomyces globisporus]
MGSQKVVKFETKQGHSCRTSTNDLRQKRECGIRVIDSAEVNRAPNGTEGFWSEA